MMKRFLTIFLSLLLITTNTYAKWLFIGEDNGINYWYDSDVIKRNDLIDVRVLINLPIKNKYGDRSALGDVRINCKSLVHKTLSNYSYPLESAQGKARSSNTTPDIEWSKIPKTSYLMTIAEVACK